MKVPFHGLSLAKGEILRRLPTYMGMEIGPSIATVLPVFNEENFIESCLRSLLDQTIPHGDHMVLILDGGSTDGTLNVIERVVSGVDPATTPKVVVMNNPGRSVAHARNLALNELPSSVEFMVEMIGHATVSPTHFEDRLNAWKQAEATDGTKLAGVGVRVHAATHELIRTESWIESAISSPLGHRGGQFSRFTKPGLTQIPAFVMHRRSAIESVGGWDEAFLSSQDSELSMRLIKAGYSLRRNPSPEVFMAKRTTLKQWWRMSFRYGFWRTKVLMKHPKRRNFAEFLPLLGIALTGTLVASGSSEWWLPGAAYLSTLCLTGLVQAFRQRRPSLMVGLPLCLAMLHTGFSLGLIGGLVRKPRAANDRS